MGRLLKGGGQRACLGLFGACQRLGVGIVQGAPLHLYLEQPSVQAIEALGLAPLVGARRQVQARLIAVAEGPVSPLVLIRRPRYPRSLFRGMVWSDGVPAADILECWLDVAGHPARGDEQAEEILLRLELDKEEWGGPPNPP